jgi:hypothetical protein
MDGRYAKNLGAGVKYELDARSVAPQPEPLPTESHFRINGSLLTIDSGRGLLMLLRPARDCEASEVRFG